MKKFLFFLLLLCGITLGAMAQDEKKYDFSGYVSDMPSVILQGNGSEVLWQNLLHNRLDFSWTPNTMWKVEVGMRNRLMFGNLLEQPGYAESISFDRSWADLSWNLIEGKDVLFNVAFDRAFVTFEKGKWNLKLGRQRINWGQTLVWNPNDIFNTYSYFDFDYVERAGCDAFRGTYYHNETSSTELAAAVDHWGKVTAAMLHRWNWKNFDYQVMGGAMNQSDLVVGGAISGDVKGLNLRAECSYFQPFKNFTDTTGTIALSFGADYIFKNSLMLQTEILYNNVGQTFSSLGILGMYAAPLSAKYLSICDWTVFAQASYPFTSRFNGSLAGMCFVEIRTYYAGITLNYSVLENMDLSVITQYFQSFDKNTMGDMQAFMGFIRLKYSF